MQVIALDILNGHTAVFHCIVYKYKYVRQECIIQVIIIKFIKFYTENMNNSGLFIVSNSIFDYFLLSKLVVQELCN